MFASNGDMADELGTGLSNISRLPDFESGVRRMVADSDGRQYRAYTSLVEAQDDPEGVVVLEGDDGGQIYVVALARHVKCSESELRRLLLDVDGFCWKDPDSAKVFYETLALNSVVSEGMGGGRVTERVWVHAELEEHGLRNSIEEVLAGTRAHIGDERSGLP